MSEKNTPEDAAALAVAFGDYWDGEYRAVSVDEHTRARSLFLALFDDCNSTEAATLVKTLGFASRWFDTPHGRVRLVHEATGARFGRGVFAFRETASTTILQAPHTRNDPWTGKLSGEWMANHDFRAAAWNTVGRNAGDGADLARARRSYFVAMADAAVDILDVPSVIQVHGFSTDRRTTEARRRSAAIVSGGCEQPASATRNIAKRLGERLDGVRLYPEDVLELGATGNPVGRRLRQREAGAFTHLEFSRPLRENLRDDRELNHWVGSALLMGSLS